MAPAKQPHSAEKLNFIEKPILVQTNGMQKETKFKCEDAIKFFEKGILQ